MNSAELRQQALNLARLAMGDDDDQEHSFVGDLETECEILGRIADEFHKERNFEVGDVIRLRREWQTHSPMADRPCVILEALETPIRILERLHDVEDFHTMPAAETLDLMVVLRLGKEKKLNHWFVDSRKFERVHTGAGE